MSTATSSIHKTEIRINVYDLLPPGRLSSFLWTIGNGLLHSGVVISGREYAFGGHEKRGVTGLYYTTPKQVPPGGTFRCEIFHGVTMEPPEVLDEVILEVRLISEPVTGCVTGTLMKGELGIPQIPRPVLESAYQQLQSFHGVSR